MQGLAGRGQDARPCAQDLHRLCFACVGRACEGEGVQSISSGSPCRRHVGYSKGFHDSPCASVLASGEAKQYSS